MDSCFVLGSSTLGYVNRGNRQQVAYVRDAVTTQTFSLYFQLTEWP